MAMFAVASPAHAQAPTQAQDIQEIVVTAQKREQSLIDVPLAVTAIGGSKLQEANVGSIPAIVQQVPSFTVSYAFGENSTPNFSIRGVTGDGLGSRLNESSVAIYKDDVYLGDESMLSGQVFDVHRAEVLRGPQGTLFGRNTTAGLVHFISASPTNEFAGYGSALYGSDNNVILEGAVSGPIADSVRVRVAGKWDRHDGHFNNYYLGAGTGGIPKKLGARDVWGGRATIDVDLSEKTLFRLIGEYSETHSEIDPGNLLGSLKPGTGPKAGYSRADQCAPKQVMDGACWEIAQVLGGAPHPRRVASQGAVGLPSSLLAATGKSGLITGKLTHDFDWATFTSITNYGFSRFSQGIEAGRASPTIGVDPVIRVPRFNLSHQVSQEIRLNGTTESFDWVVGAFYYTDHKFHRQRTEVSFPGQPFVQQLATATVDSRSYALFGQLDNRIAEQFTLSIGARYTGDKRDLKNAITSDNFGDFQDVRSYMIANGFPVTSNSRDMTGKISLTWKPSDDLSSYFSFSRGIKGAGFNAGFNPTGVTIFPTPELRAAAQRANALLTGPVGQEVLDSWELGLKTRMFDRKLSINTAAFFYQYKGKQISVPVLNPASNTAVFNFVNVGDAEVWGLETEVAFRPSDRFDINLAAGWLHNKIVKSNVTVVDGFGAAIPLKGKHLLGTPKWTFNGTAAYHIPAGDMGRFTLQAEANALSRRNYSVTGDPLADDPAYILTNLRVLWASADGKYNFQAFVTNVFNQRWASFVEPTSAAALGAVNVTEGVGRLWGVKAGVNF
ncbi:TonB-dependent receptor [Sphingobium subterraneum]|uniref:Iron complex outermembrane receptor protein n=1 Tax=Sphingobium subterraneum TaxID=627688 RepID=A0A841IUY0_9SPHN|nr:TonB-dependent receptor [Sphingobium subterraneum]MBB6122729.1 iron complex outermembrane receptor protein [Sphingobium subterraneum]